VARGREASARARCGVYLAVGPVAEPDVLFSSPEHHLRRVVLDLHSEAALVIALAKRHFTGQSAVRVPPLVTAGLRLINGWRRYLLGQLINKLGYFRLACGGEPSGRADVNEPIFF
jgi:hypothetical protein